MDLADIRRLVVIAMFSDDKLFNQLTLKGGNALNLVYRFGFRGSVDIDLSLEEDFEDIENSKSRIFRGLRGRFGEVGLVVFDEKFEKRPLQDRLGDGKWGGYQIEFKLMDAVKFELIKEDVDRARREAEVVGPAQQRVFKVQISKHEYCHGKVAVDFDDYSIYVYTPQMIVVEKLRAICQQMSEYPLRQHSTARARDFYDIHSTIASTGLELNTKENCELIRNIFAAKDVALDLMLIMENYRDFHRQDWPSVELTAGENLEAFDFYFDFVIDQIRLLKTFWNV
jgi:predicted nucleotidyltransferase component of viral defense system